MKDKQKQSLEDLDFLTELTPSEQEGINGGGSALNITYGSNPVPNGGSATPFSPVAFDPIELEPGQNWYPDTPQHQNTFTI
ncbi:hypothetical protein WA1_21185 [Scytonema hofmannii PCC 7110]|uniref:Uncharacterized protein n=1 Tax=Scytonema hofmannii PCC 7110 TaxID=128403 RepID=A0A139XCQ6_9CYAN|nr:hypothetical protein [Scytonema hofmannii]KYC42479.1 hypothetical protein WA1_21185 [Scytonema hofmannii PCC 7110]